ncbi:set domain-containing protein bromodomain-containing protein [Cyclospora cayetanensis]|uniref:Set domain-containing protein bromodomain-containing protein n=1 Tax=Cyclospora cayetanensis TaxID=88456 RepID=A0A1D3CY74_9EIME|nr:set domain-containing protein bromodomain-containing protein [Cyclospora cayetanensis]
MRRLLQGVTASTGGGYKREEVTFAEDGWARASSRKGHPYTSPAAGEEGVGAEEGQTLYPEGDYAEHDGEAEDLDYTQYYTEADGEKAAEGEGEDGDSGYLEAESPVAELEDEEAYDYSYEGAETQEGAAEDQEGTNGPYEEAEADYEDYGVDMEEKTGIEEEGDEAEASVEEEAAAEGRGEEEASQSLEPFTLSQIAQRVHVRRVEGKGRCLYTRNALAPGEVIFVERPVLVAVPSLNPELWDLLNELNGETAFELPPIWHLAALCSLTMLDEEAFNVCLDKWVPDEDSEPSQDVLRVCGYLEGDIDARLYERLLLVWRYNSFGHHTETQGLVLYNRISMMAHSCEATACWHYGEDDAFVLRSRVALNRGDEITISYIGDEELFKSTNMRREKVQGWLFTCGCSRCVDPVDKARGFRCPTCGTGSMYFKTDDEVTTSSPCSVCRTVPVDATIEQYVTFETAYADRLADTNKNDMPDAEMVYEQASRVFTRHWILFQLDTILFEGYRAAGDYESAYVHQMHRLEYVSAVLPLPSYSLAWLYEEMGDVLWSRVQAKGKPYANSRLRIAGRHFEDAYNLLYILCGPEHEYTTAAATKRNKIDELTTDV